MNRHQLALVSLIAFAILLPGAVLARTVSVPTYVCNPGATVTVPVTIDDAGGCACVDVRLTYDAQVLVPVRVEAGTLSRVFGEDRILGCETPGLIAAALFASGDVAAANGTVAVVTFRVREGTAGLFSDLTVSEVTLGTANGLNAETRENPTHVVHGMVRVVDAEADVARLERAQVVCAGTSVGSLTLAAGDGIAAGDGLGPVSVAGEVTAAGPIPVMAPEGGWRSATYRLLTTKTEGLTLALQGLGAEDVLTPGTVVGEDGRVTYTATVAVARPQPIDPETPQTFADETEAQAAADAINADKETMINVPTAAEATKAVYLALVEAKVVDGKKVVVDIAATGEAAFRGQLDEQMEDADVAAALTDATVDEVTIETVAGFYYWVEGGVEVGVINTNGDAVIGDGKPVTLTKPALGTTTRAFYRLAVGVKDPAATPIE